MRAPRLLAAVCLIGAVESCSLVTSFDSLGSGGASGGGGGGDAGVACTPGLDFCGADGDVLYHCTPGADVKFKEMCHHGCSVQPAGENDLCGSREGGISCGGHDILGDADTLYTCDKTGGVKGTFSKVCKHGCDPVEGAPDMCKSPLP